MDTKKRGGRPVQDSSPGTGIGRPGQLPKLDMRKQMTVSQDPGHDSAFHQQDGYKDDKGSNTPGATGNNPAILGYR
ncbi:hypothetical protein Pmani_010855 [Petrolisthes manimaculis]|uniref:Uncharacterized protein n=1 Tax=Petrolisthes manimaculis TaxID=1843537 RepID=A0AAE1UG98_9EUCA|nr:hypothetical protein Pmani_010855 [Petrolisthes manimaculis]